MTFELRAVDAKDAAMQRSAEEFFFFFFFTLRNYKCKIPPRATLVITDYLLPCSLGLLVEPHCLNTVCETWLQQNIRPQAEVGRIEAWDASLLSSTC